MRALALGIFFIFIVAPVVMGLSFAVLSGNGMVELIPGPLPSAFPEVLANKSFYLAIVYTFLLAASVIIASIAIALLILRFVLQTDDPNRLGWQWFVPLALPPVVAALASFSFFSDAGFLSRLLAQLGVLNDPSAFPDLVNDALGWSVFFTHVFLAFPFFVIIFLVSARSAEGRQMMDAARSLGASKKERFVKLLMPWVVRKNAALLAVWFIFVLGTYEVPLLLGNQRLRTVTVLIIDKLRGYDLANIPSGYAMSAIYAILIIILARFIVEPIDRQYGA